MTARFTQGASLASTKKTTHFGKQAPPQSNSMKGMPGSINTAQKRDSSDVLTGKTVGTKQTGPIGKKGGQDIAKHGASTAKGSMDKSYRAISTAKPGKITSQKTVPSGAGKMESLKGKAKFSMER